MPIWLKAVTGPILDGLMKGLNDGQSAGHWDWTAFTLAGKTPADVQASVHLPVHGIGVVVVGAAVVVGSPVVVGGSVVGGGHVVPAP